MPVAEVDEVAVERPGARTDGDLGRWSGRCRRSSARRSTLRYASDLPHAEIAAALGCSPEAARRSLHEGIKRLRKELA